MLNTLTQESDDGTLDSAKPKVQIPHPNHGAS